MQDGDVVLDHRGRAHHDAGGVIEEHAAPDPGCGMDIGLEHLRGPALEIEREVAPALAPVPVGEPVGLDRVEALEVEQRLQRPGRRGVAVHHREDVGAHALADGGVVLKRLVEAVSDEFRRQGGVTQPGRDPVGDRRLQGRMVEDGGDEEGGELRLVAHHRFRLVAHARPERIDDAGDRLAPGGRDERRTGGHAFLLDGWAGCPSGLTPRRRGRRGPITVHPRGRTGTRPDPSPDGA